MSSIIRSYAKINLFLDVTGRDSADGYHYIESIFQEIDLFDEIEWKKSSEDSVSFSGANVGGDSTVHRALELFKTEFGVKDCFHVRVRKRIPMGAGLGGGSSNAAALLKSLARAYGISCDKLLHVATRIGSDVPFFLRGGLCRVSGKGERVQVLSIELDHISFVVVYPEIQVSTAWAYKLITSYGDGKKINIFLKKQRLNFDFLVQIVYNRFQNFVLQNSAPLRAVKERLDGECGPAFSFMSGSGSSLVYVFSSREEAENVAKRWKDQKGLTVFCCDPICGDDKFCN